MISVFLHVVMENTEQRGTRVENGSEWSNETVHFDRTGPTEKSGPPRKVDQFVLNFSGWTALIHSVLDRNFRKFWLNGSRPMTQDFEIRVKRTLTSCLAKLWLDSHEDDATTQNGGALVNYQNCRTFFLSLASLRRRTRKGS